MVSGEGYPSILQNHLRCAIEEINETDAYNFLVVCLDTEETRPRDRIHEVRRAYLAHNRRLTPRCSLKVIVQNHCIETWFLGNRAMYPHEPSDEEFVEYAAFYNVARRDPEFMNAYRGFRTRAGFHYKYLQAMLRERGLTYTKQRPHIAAEESYLQALVERARSPEGHLGSFLEFLEFCAFVRSRIQTGQSIPDGER